MSNDPVTDDPKKLVERLKDQYGKGNSSSSSSGGNSGSNKGGRR